MFGQQQQQQQQQGCQVPGTAKFMSMARKSTSPFKLFVNNSPRSSLTNSNSNTSFQTAETSSSSNHDILKKFESEKTNTNNNNNNNNHINNGNSNTTWVTAKSAANVRAVSSKNAPKISNKQQNVCKTNVHEFVNSFVANNSAKKTLPNPAISNPNLMDEFQKSFKIYAYLALRQRYHPVFLNRNLNYLKDSFVKNKKNSSSSHFKKPKKEKFSVDDLLFIKLSRENHPSSGHKHTISLEKLNPFNTEMLFMLDSILIKRADEKKLLGKSLTSSPNDSRLLIELYEWRVACEATLIGKLSERNLEINQKLGNANGCLYLAPVSIAPFRIDLKNTHKVSVKVAVRLNNANESTRVYTCDIDVPSLCSAKSPKISYSFRLCCSNENPNGKKSSSSCDVKALLDSFAHSNMVTFHFQPIKYSSPGRSTASVEQRPVQPQRKREQPTDLYYQFNAELSKPPGEHSAASRAPECCKILTKSNTLKCPFCHLSVARTEQALVKHLTNYHVRFRVKSSTVSNGISCSKLELSIDDLFDGSYVGNLFDLYSNSQHLGYASARLRATKYHHNHSTTKILVNKRSNYLDLNKIAAENSNITQTELECLSLIQQQLNPTNQSQTTTERVYFHTKTTLPILDGELDYDSDSEMDPEWLKEQTGLFINDFADVNEGEKEIMRLWNLHCLHYNFISDAQIYAACELFITTHVDELVRCSLVNNFLLHLSNLNDYGLLSSAHISKLVNFLLSKIKER